VANEVSFPTRLSPDIMQLRLWQFDLSQFLLYFFYFPTLCDPRRNFQAAIGRTDENNTAAEIASPLLNSATLISCKSGIFRPYDGAKCEGTFSKNSANLGFLASYLF